MGTTKASNSSVRGTREKGRAEKDQDEEGKKKWSSGMGETKSTPDGPLKSGRMYHHTERTVEAE